MYGSGKSIATYDTTPTKIPLVNSRCIVLHSAYGKQRISIGARELLIELLCLITAIGSFISITAIERAKNTSIGC